MASNAELLAATACSAHPISVVFHFTPPAVAASHSYRTWMTTTFPAATTRHVMLRSHEYEQDCPDAARPDGVANPNSSHRHSTGPRRPRPALGLLASARITSTLNLTSDVLFPMPHSLAAAAAATDVDVDNETPMQVRVIEFRRNDNPPSNYFEA